MFAASCSAHKLGAGAAPEFLFVFPTLANDVRRAFSLFRNICKVTNELLVVLRAIMNWFQTRAVDRETPILKRPYSVRQLLFVTTDLLAEAANKDASRLHKEKIGTVDAAKGSVRSAKERNWKKIVAVSSVTAVGGYAALLGTLLVSTIAPLALVPLGSAATIVAYRAWNRARKRGLPVLAIGKTAAKVITFPPGHPRDEVLYVGHPTMPQVYYPMADFHRATFEHKFCEAIHLLMSLGATVIRVEHVTGWAKEFYARLSVPPLEAPSETAGVGAGQSSTKRSSLLYEAFLTGTDRPKIPKGLVWYPHEQTWQQVAKGRMQFGLNDFSLNLVYQGDFGINAGLKVAIAKAGWDLGGRFEDHQSTVWRLAGSFKTLDRQSWLGPWRKV
jgi:hypothetical protein